MLDADGVELDVHATGDGTMVVHHDPEIPGVGPIALLTRATARQVRIPNGETLPLLSEILDLVGDRDVWVEVKTLPGIHDQAFMETMDRGPAPHRYAVHSFDHPLIRRLGESRPELRRGILLSDHHDDPVGVMRAVGATTLWQDWRQVDRELVNRVHDAACTLVAWTVNEIGDLERLVRLGVDGLCGNYPDRIRVTLAARNDEVSRI
jgi:glycerophosphoryl diester phosphodiesterase